MIIILSTRTKPIKDTIYVMVTNSMDTKPEINLDISANVTGGENNTGNGLIIKDTVIATNTRYFFILEYLTHLFQE